MPQMVITYDVADADRWLKARSRGRERPVLAAGIAVVVPAQKGDHRHDCPPHRAQPLTAG